MIVLSTPNATNELHSITVTCTIHPNSTADQCVVMAMADGRVTRTGDNVTHLYLKLHNYYVHAAYCTYVNTYIQRVISSYVCTYVHMYVQTHHNYSYVHI